MIGLISLQSSQPGFYTERSAQIASAIAALAAIALENARLYEQAQDRAALEERQRLARELHDSVSQALYGIALGARTARALLDRDPAQAAEPLDYMLSLAEAGDGGDARADPRAAARIAGARGAGRRRCEKLAEATPAPRSR